MECWLASFDHAADVNAVLPPQFNTDFNLQLDSSTSEKLLEMFLTPHPQLLVHLYEIFRSKNVATDFYPVKNSTHPRGITNTEFSTSCSPAASREYLQSRLREARGIESPQNGKQTMIKCDYIIILGAYIFSACCVHSSYLF